MSFDAYEESAASGSKLELYTLTIGSTIYRMHTSAELAITSGGDIFYRTHVIRGPIATGQESLEIELPGDHAFALTHATIAPGQIATLTIQEFHRGDTSDVRVIYKGVVRAVAFTNNAATSTLSVVPLSGAFKKEIPERTYQAMCNNVLFDSRCQVSSGSYLYTDAIYSVSGNTVAVTGLNAAKGTGWSTGGFAQYGALDFRLILEQGGDTLTLVLPFYNDVTGQDVTVYAGCDKDMTTCNSKFNNSINYGGCLYVPTKNIFTQGVN